MPLTLLALLAWTPAWQDVPGPLGTPCGRATVASLPHAAFPAEGAPWKDDRTWVFVPDGWRDRGPVDVTLHFHGWYTHLEDTLGLHRYAEQAWASGANTLLVVPQGPVNAASGDFGNLMRDGGVAALLGDVLDLLRSSGVAQAPTLGDLAITAHSGGYLAAAHMLQGEPKLPRPRTLTLLDALYGNTREFLAFVEHGGRLRSVWATDATTGEVNRDARARLRQASAHLGEHATAMTLRDAGAVIWQGRGDHYGITWADDTYAEILRWGASHGRRGPRVELREARCDRREGLARWVAPLDEDVLGWDLELWTRDAPEAWRVVASVPADADRASFRCDSESRLRVRPRVRGVADPQASDIYAVAPYPKYLVVDAVDRVARAPSTGLAHDAAARVGEAAEDVATVSDEAVTEDGFNLAPWRGVIWLTGPDGVEEGTLSLQARDLLRDYVAGGGHLVVSGSGVARDLGATDGLPRVVAGKAAVSRGTHGQTFLTTVFGAKLRAPQSASTTVRLDGKRLSLGGKHAAYATPPFDSLLAAQRGAQAFATWPDGRVAGVGIRGKSLLLAFPIELVEQPTARAQVVQRALRFVRAG